MSFTCDTCNKTLPVGADWSALPVLRQFGDVYWLDAVPRRRPGNARSGSCHAHARRAGASPGGRQPDWAGSRTRRGAAVVAVLLLILLGMAWVLVSHSRGKQDRVPVASAAAAEDRPAPLPRGPGRRAAASRCRPPADPARTGRPETGRPAATSRKVAQPAAVPELPVLDPPRLLPLPAPPADPMPKVDPKPPPQAGPPAPAQPKIGSSSAVFMGVKASGKRFCIIADCSGSMAYNNRMVRSEERDRAGP